MIDKYNSFDVRLAYQFLKYKDDLKPDEEQRECYRHVDRFFKSPYSSESAIKLMNFYVDVINKDQQSMAKCKDNLAKICRRILKKSKTEISNMFDENMSNEILKILEYSERQNEVQK